MTKLPVYEMVIDENPESEVEVSFVALVDKPAIEKNFMAFKDLQLNFAADPERQIISGPAMVADSLIYRRDAGGEYNVFFSKETIQEIALKFFKKDYQKNLNLFHDPALSLQGVTIFESFISDKSRGIQPMKGFEDLPDGTWFISAKVENPAVWEKIKSGEVKGFSVEGIFSYMKKPKDVALQIAEVLNATYTDNGLLLGNGSFMTAIEKMVANLKKTFFDGTSLVPPAAPAPVPAPAPAAPAALNTDYTLKDGVTAVSIDKLEVGGVVMIAGVPAPAGEHELADGTKVTVGEGGLITAVMPSAAAAPMAAPPAALPIAANSTPQQQMTALTAVMKKFASGTPEERLQNLELVSKALMEYSFGWQIREEQEKAARESAINIYKNSLGAAEVKLAAAEKALTEQKATLTGLFEIVEELAKVPTADAVGDQQLSFSAQKALTAQEQRAKLVATLKKIRTKN